MKKTIVTLLVFLGISAENLYAQTSEDIYIIGTSVYSPIKLVTPNVERRSIFST